MKNLQKEITMELSQKEIRNINGGNDNPSVWDDGSGDGCIPGPIIIIKPTTGPTFPDPDILF